MNKKISSDAVENLFQAVLSLENVEECHAFFEDICTINELLSLSQRYEVARMLREKKTYLEIAAKTGASTATISRVNRSLNYGNDGYNLVMDRLLGDERLFDQAMIERDVDYYIKKQNTYGVPLDCRAAYTKSDWILWCASFFDDREQARQMIKPIARYLSETATRYPFSDWYDTVTGEYCHFKGRSVQGGIFMPLLASEL